MPDVKFTCRAVARQYYFVICHIHLIRFKNSFLVLAELRKIPEKADVAVIELDFCTPLIVMHVCIASITTATPIGCRAS